MTGKPISHRSGMRKTGETAIDLTLLALAVPFCFSLARARGWSVPPDVESTGTALIMAVGGTAARAIRHRLVYGTWG